MVKRYLLFSLFLFLSMGIVSSCDKKNDDNKNNGSWSNNQAIRQKIDLSDAAGLLVVNEDSVTSRHIANAKYLGVAPRFTKASQVKGLKPRASSSSSDDGGLKKIDNSGEVTSTIETKPDDATNTNVQPLPSIRTIGVSDQGDVYLHYERNFIYRNTDDSGTACTDPWSQGSPCSCQIFRVKETLGDLSTGSVAAAWDNIECLDNGHTINPWQQVDNKVFQFDEDGNVYYLGQLPESQKTVLYRVLRDKDSGGSYQLQEVVNSFICVRDFVVTKNGGVFYIGQTCNGENGFSGGDGSFFRYVEPQDANGNSSVVEISRNWWEYTFEPIENEDADQVIFYGPDPEPATETIATWNSTCLFQFDPSQDQGSRSDKLVTCNNDIWGWLQLTRQIDIEGIEGDADHPAYGQYNSWNNPPYLWRNEYKNRCISANRTFIGSSNGSPIKNIKQTSNGDTYIVGDISVKKAGTYSCQVNVKGPHCLDALNHPIVNTITPYDEAACTAISGATWKADGWCERGSGSTALDCRLEGNGGNPGNSDAAIQWRYNNAWYNDITYVPADAETETDASGTICLEEGMTRTAFDASSDTLATTRFMVNGTSCQSPPSTGGNDAWTDQYKGLAFVNSTTKEMILKSTTNEQVIDMWIVNDVIYYSSYAQGVYRFRKVTDGVTNKTLISAFEVYNVVAHPSDSTKLLIDGLDFTNNAYTFGPFDEAAIPADPDVAALGADSANRGQPPVSSTGQVKQMVIIGSGA